jgi:hypothetical protein
MMGTRTLLLGLAAPIGLAVLAGCGGGGKGPPRVAVSGKVTFQGKAVADGQIRFVPKPGTKAPVTVEAIKNGTYDTSPSGGVPVGEHRVEILAFDPNQPAPQGPGEPPRKQLLPPKYNTKTQLELKVEAGAKPITKDFELGP